MDSHHSIRPFRFFYFLSGLIVLLGIASFIGILYQGLQGLESSMKRFRVPGDVELRVSDPGTFTVYFEYQSVYQGRAYDSSENLPGLQVHVRRVDSLEEIPVRETTTRSTYSFGGRKGRSVFQFKINEPGTYTVSGTYPDKPGAGPVILSVSRGFVKRLTLTIGLSLGALFFSFIIAIVLAVVIYLKRDKFKKRLEARAMGRVATKENDYS